MKYLLLIILVICLGEQAVCAAEGEKIEIRLPEGFHVEKMNEGQFSRKSGDVLIEKATNDKKDVVQVFYAANMPVSDADVPRFLEVMSKSLAGNGVVKVQDSKAQNHNGRNWGAIELSIPTHGDTKQIILVTSLQGGLVRIVLESPSGTFDDLRAYKKKIIADTKLELPKQ
jgi:hypothetical protein